MLIKNPINHKALINYFYTPELYITNKCNQNCLFCSADANTERPGTTEKSLDWIKKNLSELRSYSSRIKITGGEPTTRKDFLEIVRCAKSLNFHDIIIETNGQKFSEKNFAEEVIRAGANIFLISVLGHTPKVHDALTGMQGSFRRTRDGVMTLKNFHQNTSINVVITEGNYKFLPEIITFWSKLKMRLIRLSFIIVQGAADKNRAVVPRMTSVVPYLEKAVRNTAVKVGIDHIPFCLLGDLNKHNIWFRVIQKKIIENANFTITIEPKISHDLKADACHKCRFDHICFGLREGYVKIHGLDELTPVPGKKISDYKEFLNNKEKHSNFYGKS